MPTRTPNPHSIQTRLFHSRLILVANPGPGILTEQLLALGCKKLYIYEDQQSPHLESLCRIQNAHETRVKLIRENLLRMAFIFRDDMFSGTKRMERMFEGIPHQAWHQEPCATAVISVPEENQRRFVYTLLFQLAAKSLIFSVGRVDLLLFISSLEYEALLTPVRPFAATVLFDLFFDRKLLGSFPVDSFKFNHDYAPRRRKCQSLSLVRLTPRTDIFERLHEPRRVEEFAFFVRQVFRRGATLMYLNELIPNSVRDVLLKTRWSEEELQYLTLNTKLATLSSGDLLRLFEIFSACDLYTHCPLVTDVDTESLFNLAKR